MSVGHSQKCMRRVPHGACLIHVVEPWRRCAVHQAVLFSPTQLSQLVLAGPFFKNMGGRNAEDDVCKWCQRPFATTLNPTVKDPSPEDLLKRRTPNSRECRPCHHMIMSDPNYAKLTSGKMQSSMEDEAFNNTFMNRLAAWEEARRKGKRTRATSADKTMVTAEQSSSMQTREIVGYHWPKWLLKKHGLPFKKLTSIQHGGKAVLGVTRTEWVLGAIEIVQSSPKTAKRTREHTVSDSDDDDMGKSLYSAMEQQVRSSAKVSDAPGQDESELQLKAPVKISSLEDEFASILFGGGQGSSRGSRDPASDEEDGAAAHGRNRNPKRRASSCSDVPSSMASEAQDNPLVLPPKIRPTGKKQGADARELDKSEAVLLQATQLLTVLQTPDTIMSVQLSKATSLLEKLRQRLTEDLIAVYSDMVRREGQESRAASVWGQLKDKVAVFESTVSFIEALHDEEATAATLSARASQLRSMGVQLPSFVNAAICRRDLDVMAQASKFEEFFKFIDPQHQADYPNGICSVGIEERADGSDSAILDFQTRSVVQAINGMLLTCWKDPDGPPSAPIPAAENAKAPCNPAEAAEAKKKAQLAQNAALDHSVKRLSNFLAAYEASSVCNRVKTSASAAPAPPTSGPPSSQTSAASEMSVLKDELQRLSMMAKYAISGDHEVLNQDEMDVLSTSRSALIKNRQGNFYRGLTLFPVGMYLSETIAQKVSQAKRDQLLDLELSAAVQISTDLKALTLEHVLKEKPTGEMDVFVPNSAKICEMTSKWVAALETSSARFREDHAAEFQALGDRVNEIKQVLLLAVAEKTSKEFGEIAQLLVEFCKIDQGSQDQNVKCGGCLTKLANYQPLPKLPLARLLGKTVSQELETCLAASWKFFGCLDKSFPPLIKLSQVPASEGGIIGEQIVEMYHMVHDSEVLGNVLRTAPWMRRGLDAVRVLLENNAKAWMHATSTSFSSFVGVMLEPEPHYDSIIDRVPELIIAEEDSDINKVDFEFIYTTFVKPMKFDKEAAITIKVKTGDSSVERRVHASYLCACGALAQMSKNIYVFKDVIAKAGKCEAFHSLLQACVEAAKQKDKNFCFKSKAMILAESIVGFDKLVVAAQRYEALVTDVKKHKEQGLVFDVPETCGASILKKFHGYIMEALILVNEEVTNITKKGKDLHDAVVEKHHAPEIFRAEPLNKQAIQALVADPNSQTLALFVSKTSETLTTTQQLLASIRKFPTSLGISTSCLQMLSAMETDMDRFLKVGDNKTGAAKVDLPALQSLHINMTMSQAMVRDLGAGETRLGLVGKCHELAKNRGLNLDSSLRRRAQAMLNLKGK